METCAMYLPPYCLIHQFTVLIHVYTNYSEHIFIAYLGGEVCGDGKTEREVRRRVQAGAIAWKAVEGVMADRRISKILKGKVMSTCVSPACLYGTETLALTEPQQ